MEDAYHTLTLREFFQYLRPSEIEALRAEVVRNSEGTPDDDLVLDIIEQAIDRIGPIR